MDRVGGWCAGARAARLVNGPNPSVKVGHFSSHFRCPSHIGRQKGKEKKRKSRRVSSAARSRLDHPILGPSRWPSVIECQSCSVASWFPGSLFFLFSIFFGVCVCVSRAVFVPFFSDSKHRSLWPSFPWHWLSALEDWYGCDLCRLDRPMLPWNLSNFQSSLIPSSDPIAVPVSSAAVISEALCFSIPKQIRWSLDSVSIHIRLFVH